MAEKIAAHISPHMLDNGLDSDLRGQCSEDGQVMEQMGKL